MKFIPATNGSIWFFNSILAGILFCFLYAVYFAAFKNKLSEKKNFLKIAIGTFGWLSFMSALVLTGWVEESPMPRGLIFLMLGNVAALVFSFSKWGDRIVEFIPIRALLLFQSFRIPLEMVLHDWVQQGTVPPTMTWSYDFALSPEADYALRGLNYDVLSGLIALFVGLFLYRNRFFIWFANLVGILLLVNVGRIAILSSPVPFAWPIENPLQLVFHMPYALIGPVCVSGALLGHVLLTRSLFNGNRILAKN